MILDEVKAIGEYVVFKCVEQKAEVQKTKAGLILPAGMQKQSAQSHNINGEKKSVALILHDIGSAVPTDKFIAKVGDECVVNLYDAQYIGDDTITYCLTRWSSVGAVVKARRTE